LKQIVAAGPTSCRRQKNRRLKNRRRYCPTRRTRQAQRKQLR